MERKISISKRSIEMDFIQRHDIYTVNLGEGDEFPLVHIYNNLSYEIIHSSGGKVFGITGLHILLKELLEIINSKQWSDNYKTLKQAALVKIMLTDTDINKFIANPENILKFNYGGVYKDLKIEKRKIISKEYIFGEKRTFRFEDIK